MTIYDLEKDKLALVKFLNGSYCVFLRKQNTLLRYKTSDNIIFDDIESLVVAMSKSYKNPNRYSGVLMKHDDKYWDAIYSNTNIEVIEYFKDMSYKSLSEKFPEYLI